MSSWLHRSQKSHQHEHCACVLSCYSAAKLCLFVTPWTVALQALLFLGILLARIILEWVARPSSRRSSQPRDRTGVSFIAGGFFTIWATRKTSQENGQAESSSQSDVYSTFCLKCHPLMESPSLFCLDLSNFPSLPAPCPQKDSLHSFQPMLPTAENATKKIKNTQILLKNFSNFSLPPDPRFQDLPWMTLVFLLTLISLPSWASLSAWHHMFPPESRLYECRSSCLGSSSPYPLFHQLPTISSSCSVLLVQGSLPNPSTSSPSTCIPPLSHSSDCQFLCNLLLDGKLWESRAVSCLWFFPGSWHIDSRSLLNGWLKDEWRGCAGRGLALRWSGDATHLQRIWRLDKVIANIHQLRHVLIFRLTPSLFHLLLAMWLNIPCTELEIQD